ncbi:hypothetical protein O3P69_000465 [Scylla paramamosain]|uniref:Uncharacterized protein n=1 Tax=Scylla paramamosain TaxID=85552 RepID=A0AAW0UTA9_SCYPA
MKLTRRKILSQGIEAHKSPGVASLAPQEHKTSGVTSVEAVAAEWRRSALSTALGGRKTQGRGAWLGSSSHSRHAHTHQAASWGRASFFTRPREMHYSPASSSPGL